MRLLKLHLRPFGALSDQEFEFGGDGPGGLHVIYGPNGAGKSTTLNALRSVLFGIGTGRKTSGRSGESAFDPAHSFNSKDLRLAAHLRRADGTELEFVRRSANASPLWNATDDEAIAEELLLPFLGKLDRAGFETFYGLDHKTMARGGRELLKGEGEIGKALFGTGLGGNRLWEVMRRLEEELEELYKERGKGRRVDVLLRSLKDLAAESRKGGISPSAFERKRRELRRARQKAEQIKERRAARAAERKELARWIRALPVLERRDVALRERAACGDFDALPATVIERVQALERESANLAGDVARRAEAAGARSKRIAELSALSNPKLLSSADELDDLLSRRSEYREARAQLPARSEDLAKARAARERLAHELGQARGVQVDPGDATHAIDAIVGSHTQACDATKRAGAEQRRSLAALKRAEDHADGIEELLADEFATELTGLGPFLGTLAELAALVPPPLPVVEARKQFERELEAERAKHLRQREETAAIESSACARLSRMELEPSGIPPSPEDIARARAKRDEIWNALRRGGDARVSSGAADGDALSAAMADADAVVDRYCAQQDRALDAARARAEMEAAALQSAELESAVAETEQRRREGDRAWKQAWASLGFEPADGDSMQQWGLARTALLAKVADRKERARAEVARAQRELDERDAALDEAQAALAEANGRWNVWAGKLGWDPAIGPERAREKLSGFQALAQAERDVARLEPECESMLAVAEAFEADARALSTSAGVGQEVAGSDVVERTLARAAALVEGRCAASEIAIQLETLESERRVEAGVDERDNARRREIAVELGAIQVEVGAGSLAELTERVSASERVRACDTIIARTLAELAPLGRGASVGEPAELLAEIAGRSAEQLESEDAELVERDNADVSELGALQEEIGSLAGWVEGEGSDVVAGLESRRANLHAALAEQTERYVQVKMAHYLLNREVERYRLENQGPLLERAGELFRLLTCDTYAGLAPSVDAKGKSVLVARRPDGRQVGVSGLSTGTEDQLYLALRIASVEQMARTTEPMPFIADDLFVNFDDERTEAALRVLAQMARTLQVIVFSHHAQVVDASGRLADEGVEVHVHSLGSERARDLAQRLGQPEREGLAATE